MGIWCPCTVLLYHYTGATRSYLFNVLLRSTNNGHIIIVFGKLLCDCCWLLHAHLLDCLTEMIVILQYRVNCSLLRIQLSGNLSFPSGSLSALPLTSILLVDLLDGVVASLRVLR